MDSSRLCTAILVRPPHFPRELLDLDDPLVDFGHFEPEQRRDEQRIGARKHQARPLGRLLHPLEHRANRFALAEALPRILFLPRNDRLGIARSIEHEHELAALDLLHLSRKQLADPVGVFLANALAFTFADQLHDPLLGRHDGIAPNWENSTGISITSPTS